MAHSAHTTPIFIAAKHSNFKKYLGLAVYYHFRCQNGNFYFTIRPPEPATLEHTNYEAGRPIRPAGKEDK